jgi:hypothetical protein
MSTGDSSGRPVNLSASGPPATVIDREPAEALYALRTALSEPSVERREAVSAVVARRSSSVLRGRRSTAGWMIAP